MPTLRIEAHRHGIVLARPLLRALLLALAGSACFLAPWSALAIAGAALLALAALLAVVAVARWDRTHLVLTADALHVEHGLLHRSTASVALEPGGVVEVERSLLGRVLGYATVAAGELEVDAVPRRLANRLAERTFGK
jgi:uncharacterized membrane protein YdbT with pleckstrin-like domain